MGAAETAYIGNIHLLFIYFLVTGVFGGIHEETVFFLMHGSSGVGKALAGLLGCARYPTVANF